jgi:hypothetical protein
VSPPGRDRPDIARRVDQTLSASTLADATIAHKDPVGEQYGRTYKTQATQVFLATSCLDLSEPSRSPHCVVMWWLHRVIGSDVLEVWRLRARASVLDLNDGIVSAAGIAEGFASAGASDSVLLVLLWRPSWLVDQPRLALGTRRCGPSGR